MRQRMLFVVLVSCLAAWQVACGGGGGGQISQPPPSGPAPTVTVSASPAEVASGQSSTLTISATNATSCSVQGGSLSDKSVDCDGGTVSVSPSTNTTYTVTATGDGGSATDSATVMVQLAITVSPTSADVDTSGTNNSVLFATTTIGGDRNATVKWSASSNTGTFSSSRGSSVAWTAPTTLPTSPETVTVTATATDGTGNTAQTATADATITVTRLITISLAPQSPIPNHELYLDYGDLEALINVWVQCTGCEAGDTIEDSDIPPTTLQENFINPWQDIFNFVGPGYIPHSIWEQVLGPGAKNNTLWLLFDGSQNEAVQDPSTGEIYYYNSGDGTDGSGEIMRFGPDGTVGKSIASGTGSGNESIAFDNGTIYLTQPMQLTAGLNGVVAFNASDGTPKSGFSIANGEPGAISASDGLVCVTIPTGSNSPNQTDAADCHNSGGTFTLPQISAGSEPTAIKVVDSSHVEVYGRGDATLQWYTISGTAGTAVGALQLSGFTETDSPYWKTYPLTGGWDLAQVGSTIGVMGQVVNGDGTVSEKLALINNVTFADGKVKADVRYLALPEGTVHITGDLTNNAIVAEYPDFTGATPIMRFERIYVDTGNSTFLESTSSLAPGAAFLATQDGKMIVTCVQGKYDFEPNQSN